jgi:hypothetical protein
MYVLVLCSLEQLFLGDLSVVQQRHNTKQASLRSIDPVVIATATPVVVVLVVVVVTPQGLSTSSSSLSTLIQRSLTLDAGAPLECTVIPFL